MTTVLMGMSWSLTKSARPWPAQRAGILNLYYYQANCEKYVEFVSKIQKGLIHEKKTLCRKSVLLSLEVKFVLVQC
jgi:hypothetical protein